MPFDNTIKRMFVIVKNMHEDAITALETHNKTLANDVINRDMDADRLNWLIARQTNMLMQNASLSRKMGISPGLAMNYYHAQPDHRAGGRPCGQDCRALPADHRCGL